jgi:hypothetical protein
VGREVDKEGIETEGPAAGDDVVAGAGASLETGGPTPLQGQYRATLECERALGALAQLPPWVDVRWEERPVGGVEDVAEVREGV